MAARFGFRAAQQTLRQPATRVNFQSNLNFAQRRGNQTAAGQATEQAAQAIKQSALKRLWKSPVGPKTVHFWAPIMKWGLVLAGAADFARPAEQLSLSQNAALMATGLIWTRWCCIIRPRNLFLASVNFLLFCVGATQVGRVLSYQSAQKHSSVGHELKEAVKAQTEKAEIAIENTKAKLAK